MPLQTRELGLGLKGFAAHLRWSHISRVPPVRKHVPSTSIHKAPQGLMLETHVETLQEVGKGIRQRMLQAMKTSGGECRLEERREP